MASKNITTNLQQNNTIVVTDHSFINTNVWDKRTYIKWEGGMNGSKQPQLPYRVFNDQIAVRTIYRLWYPESASLHKKGYIHVRSADKYNMNPYNMVMEDTTRPKNDPDRFCDVTMLNEMVARKYIATWLARH